MIQLDNYETYGYCYYETRSDLAKHMTLFWVYDVTVVVDTLCTSSCILCNHLILYFLYLEADPLGFRTNSPKKKFSSLTHFFLSSEVSLEPFGESYHAGRNNLPIHFTKPRTSRNFLGLFYGLEMTLILTCTQYRIRCAWWRWVWPYLETWPCDDLHIDLGVHSAEEDVHDEDGYDPAWRLGLKMTLTLTPGVQSPE